MKAAVFSYPPRVDIREVETPRPARGEVIIEVQAAALCGTDLRIARSGHGTIGEGETRILGHEVVGIIHEVGDEVDGLVPGLKVAVAPNFGCGHCRHCTAGNTHHCPESKAMGITYDGGFARYMRVPERAVRQGNVFPLPEEADFVTLSFVEALACVVHGFLPLQLGLKERVLIYGAGPIGLMFMELSFLRGAGEVWLADLSRERLQTAQQRGAAIIPVQERPVKECIPEADVIVVAAPSPQAQKEAIEMASLFARINYFGGLPPQVKEVALPSNLIHYKEMMVTGTTRSNNVHFRMALDLMLSGKIDLSYLVSHLLPLEEIESGLSFMENQESLKVVIQP